MDLWGFCDIIYVEILLKEQGRKQKMTDKKVIDIEAARSKRKPSRKDKKKVRKPSKKKEKAQLSPRMRKKRNKQIIFTIIVMVVLGGLIGYNAHRIISLKVDNNRLQTEQEKLIKERDDLKEDAKNVNSLEYIEQQARLKLHLVLPGEILYVLPEEESTTDED